jgi:hypothetical protein
MPIATDSGYLPDWLQALLGQGGVTANAPVGLFSDTAARGSPAPNIGLLSSLPQFTGLQPPSSVPAFQGGNAPVATNSYPSMTMPQDPGPMNLGPGGNAPLFTSMNTTAPAFQGGNAPPAIQDQYANVPLPPRRPNDLTSFQAKTAEDPTDLNTPPPGRPNSNVIGTQASGAPEVTAQKSLGLGDYLGKAANAIGGIYGAGGPGDALIALGLSNRTNGASIQALNSMILNRSRQAELGLKEAEANDKIKAIAGNVALVRRLYPNLSDQEISAFARNPEMMKQIGQVAAPMEQWSAPYKDSDGNLAVRHLRTGDTKILVKSPEPQLVDLATGKYGPNGQQEFIKTWVGRGEGGAAIPADSAVGAPFSKQPEVSVNTAIDPVLSGAGAMFIDQAKTAQSSADQVRSIHDARRALDSPGGVITGFKANDRLALKQLAEMFGADSRGVENTQTFNAAMKPVIMASLGGSLGTGISNADRDFLQRASGADATLDEKAIRRILDINEKIAREKIDRHNSNADEYIQANPTLAKVSPTLKVKMPGEYAPPVAADSGKQPPANARQAADGNYYIPDPNRPGKYLRWTP